MQQYVFTNFWLKDCSPDTMEGGRGGPGRGRAERGKAAGTQRGMLPSRSPRARPHTPPPAVPHACTTHRGCHPAGLLFRVGALLGNASRVSLLNDTAYAFVGGESFDINLLGPDGKGMGEVHVVSAVSPRIPAKSAFQHRRRTHPPILHCLCTLACCAVQMARQCGWCPADAIGTL